MVLLSASSMKLIKLNRDFISKYFLSIDLDFANLFSGYFLQQVIYFSNWRNVKTKPPLGLCRRKSGRRVFAKRMKIMLIYCTFTTALEIYIKPGDHAGLYYQIAV